MRVSIDEEGPDDLDGHGPEADDSDRHEWLQSVPWVLRSGAFLFLLVGFVGAYSADESPIAVDSIYSFVFFAGVGCGVASIYLALYLHRPEDG